MSLILETEGPASAYRADSGIDLVDESPSTSPPTKHHLELESPSPRPLKPLAARLSELAAVASAAEKCNALSDLVYSTLHSQLDGIESHLDGRQTTTTLPLLPDDSIEPPVLFYPPAATEEEEEEEEDSQHEAIEQASREILDRFTTTVSSLRLRHQEQRHLHGLLTKKLEAAAQRCLEHERSLQDLNEEIRQLKQSNNTFRRHADDLRMAMGAMKAQAVEKEVAMEAMTGAVSGLEGWIESYVPPNELVANGDLVEQQRRQRREVVRGHGRFRGRYSLDGSAEARRRFGLDGTSEVDSRDLREGVKAWLRGFRDVEEGLRARQNGNRALTPGKIENEHGGLGIEEEEWGRFETVSAASYLG